MDPDRWDVLAKAAKAAKAAKVAPDPIDLCTPANRQIL